LKTNNLGLLDTSSSATVPHLVHLVSFDLSLLLLFRPCQCSPEGTDPSNTQCNEKGECSCKRNVIGAKCTQCKTGFYGLERSNPHGCKQCFCYGHSSVCEAAMGYTRDNTSNHFSSGREGWTVINEQGTCYNFAIVVRMEKAFSLCPKSLSAVDSGLTHV